MNLDKRAIIEKEKEFVGKFFYNQNIDIPDLPGWISDELVGYWNENLFDIHYLPPLALDESLVSPLWKDRPSTIFYQKIREGQLADSAKILSGKWILIDARNKPVKRVPWINIGDMRVFIKLGFNPKNYFKKWGKQAFLNEYLSDTLIRKGFGSRFCLNIYDINDLKPGIAQFLKIDPSKTIRLPFFIEYNYLGNNFYPQWKTTKIWEWFEDKFENKENLAGGYGSCGSIGWDPPEFWSTILTFRPVVEL